MLLCSDKMTYTAECSTNHSLRFSTRSEFSRTGNTPPGRASDQTNSRVENGLQALNVAVVETSEYNVTVVEPTVY